jgi:hypothetical protein
MGSVGLFGTTAGTLGVTFGRTGGTTAVAFGDTLGGTVDGVAWIANDSVVGSGTTVLGIADDVVNVSTASGAEAGFCC